MRTLDLLSATPEDPAVIVVDNASSDGTAEAVRCEFPRVRLVRLGRNRGAAARNVGVRLARTPYVAFSDDDSWWEPGALTTAADVLDAHPGLGLIAAKPVLRDGRATDPIAEAMATSPLPGEDGQPGPPVLGFLACAAVVRREAFLSAGGFSGLLFFVGEERLLAYDLAAAGWTLNYVPSVVAVHDPSPRRAPRAYRDRLEQRNELLTTWLRRPVPVALARTRSLAVLATRSATARSACLAAFVRLPAALARRHRLPQRVERSARLLEEG